MLNKSLKFSLISLTAYLASCVLTGAAGIGYDFNSGLPAGTSVAGTGAWSPTNGIGNSGCVKITVNANGVVGGFTVPDFNGGIAVTNFRAKFKVLIGGGTDRPADGMSFNFANNIGTATPGEDGTGTGITISFDTWDNLGVDDPDPSPAIELRVGGSMVAFQELAGIRDGGRAPTAPILTNAAGDQVALETAPPASSGIYPTNYVDVVVQLFGDNSISVSFSNVSVFDHVATSYTPIAGGSWVFGARTGGANDNHWIDNLEIAANFTPGPATITQGPQNQTVTESQTATFSAQIQGTPPYSIQWYSNASLATPVAIPGANALSYTTPPTIVAMSGLHYHVEVSGAESTTPAVSEDAVLTVNAGVVAQTVSSRLYTNKVYVTYNKNVTLNGTYTLNPAVNITGVAHGSSDSEVVLTTDLLTPNTQYCLTIQDVFGQDSSNLIPNPTQRCFQHGVGGVCTLAFDGSALPANWFLKGAAATNADGTLHLHEAVNGTGGGLFYSGYQGSIDRLHATFDARIGLEGNIGAGADGFSFNIAGNIPAGETGLCDPYCAEGGVGTGLSVIIDTWDDGSLNDPSIDVTFNGSVVAHRYFDRPNGEQVERDHFVPVVIDLTPDGKISVSYDSISIFNNVQISNFNQILNPQLGIYGRTGGQNEQCWIDNLCITHAYTLGPVFIVTEPGDQTVTETYRATFQVVLDGSPPYTIQWYSNDVAIAGANGETYITPPATLAMSGTHYKATISNGQNTVTTRNALLTVNPGVLVSAVSTRNANDKVYVTFTKPIDINLGTFSIDHGVVISTKTYGANLSEVILQLSASLVVDTTYTLTVAGVKGVDTSPLAPDPTIVSFRFGYGAFCTDFGTDPGIVAAPAGTTLYGNGATSGYISNGIVHITDNIGGLSGALVVSNRTGGLPLDRVYANWRMLVNGGADGVSFNWGSDVFGPSSEEGLGTGLVVVFDTYPNVATQPRFAIKWKGAEIATLGPAQGITTASISKGRFVDVQVALDPDGTVDVWYDNQQLFTNVALPNFAPIANSGFSWAGRTGGVSEDAWIDNVCINSFTPGPLKFLVEPVDTTKGETLPVTFTAVVDGSPQYRYQWFTNNVPVPGAIQSTLNFGAAQAYMDGMQVKVVVSNDFSMVTSSNATLHVTLNPRVVRATICDSNVLLVTFTRPVILFDQDFNLIGSYTLDQGAGSENSRNYGRDHSEVVLTFDQNFNPGTTYTLTVAGVRNEANDLPMDPDPTIKPVTYDTYTRYSYDFNSVPATTNGPIGSDMTVYGSAYVLNGVVHLTDTANSISGGLVKTNINNGQPVNRFVIRYRQSIAGPVGNASQPFGGQNPADGGSLVIGNSLPSTIVDAEEGGTTGLSVCFDNWDNNNGGGVTEFVNAEGPSIDIKVGNRILVRGTINQTFGKLAMAQIIRTADPNTMYDVYLDVEPDGKLYLDVNGVSIYNGLQTPFIPSTLTNPQVGFYGRTGGANENYWIDNVQINNETLGAPVIVRQPPDTTVNELGSAYFSVSVDGLPSFAYQWYSNGVAVAGGTNSSINTGTVDRQAEGRTYQVLINSACGSVTSRVAVLHITQDNIVPSVFWIAPDQTYTNLLLLFSETLASSGTGSGANAANYSMNNGIIVLTATFVPSSNNRYVALTLSGPINPVNCNILTINGVNDLTGYNPIPNRRHAITLIKAPLPTSGADNLVVIEAEDLDVNRSPGFSTPAANWVFAKTLPGYAGAGYMDATPNGGPGSGDTAATLGAATSMDYFVNFGAAGTYYIFARGSTANDGGNNSFQLNVDNVSQGTSARQIGNGISNWGGDGANVNKFGWVNHANAAIGTRAQVSIATPGVHVLTVVMREDGLKLDKFFLTTDVNGYNSLTNFANAGDLGPAATVRPPSQNLRIARDNIGNSQINWSGANWVLQATAGLSNNPAQTLWQDLPYPSGTVIPAGFFPTSTNITFRLICK